MINHGIVKPGSTILFPFNTFDSNDPSASVAIAAFILADIGIYKGTSMTERASTTGVVLLDTDGIDLDAAVGIGGFSIDLSSNATAGFYASGSTYYVTVGPVTVDAAVVNFIAGTFTIGYPDAIINTTVASVTSQTQFILSDGPAEADALIGCSILFHDVASAVQIAYGYITDYIVTTKEVICTDPVGFTFVATDNVSIFMPSNVHAVQGTTQTAGDLAAAVITNAAGVDIAADIIALKAETAAILIDTMTTLQAELDAIQAAVITNAAGADVAADIIALKAETALILTDTGTTLQAELDAIQAAVITNAAGVDIAADIIAVKAETALIVADTNELQTDDIPTKIATAQTDLDTITGASGAILLTATQASIDAIEADTNELQVDDIPADIAAVKAETALIVADTNELQVDDTPAAIAALNDLSAADVNAQVVDVLKTDTVTLPGQTAPPLAPTFEQMISWLYKVLRNRTTQTATQWSLLADDESTVDAKATVSDDATTAIKQEIVSGA